MSGRIIGAIVLKDLREFWRCRTSVLALALGLGFMITIFWTAGDVPLGGKIRVGLCPASYANAVNAALALARLGRLGEREEALSMGVEIVPVGDEASLRAAVSGEGEGRKRIRIAAGIALPDDFLEAARAGRTTSMSLYVDARVSEDVRTVVTCAVHELAHGLRAAAGGTHPIEAFPVVLPDLKTITLGGEIGGVRLSQRAVLRMLMAFGLLAIAATTVASLIAIEIERRTIAAMLVTPATLADVLAAKGILGVAMCAGLSLGFLLVTQYHEENIPLVTALVLIGAVQLTALAMIAGAAGRGIANTCVRTLVFSVPFTLPIASALAAAGTSLFEKALPSYGVARGLVDVIAYGRGWSHVMPHVYLALAWTAALLGVGLVVLKRKVGRL
ncbi:MAG: hypothetical protein ACYTKD_10005 [Planctomycetota bacterium]|jgi:ABC-2 type transport system permease protein